MSTTNTENQILILGVKPNKIDGFRESARVVLYNPKTNLYALQYQSKWHDYGTLGGGIDEGETLLQTAKRETMEESGYTDFIDIIQLGGQVRCYFYDESDCKNKERLSTGFLVVLNSEKNVGPQLEDYEIETGSECVWLSKEESLAILERQLSTDFGYSYHLEIFKRAVEKIKELNLEVLNFGTPHPDAQFRPSIIATVYDISTDKYLYLFWTEFDWYGLVLGGIDNGETALECMKRELKEETGLVDIKEIVELGAKVVSYYYADNKKVWRALEEQGFLVVLNSRKSVEQALETNEKFELRWSDAAEIRAGMKERNSAKSQFDHLVEILNRGERVVEKINLKN